ncbi:MAG: sulfurtransferase [Phycisphaerae bacterium]
MQDSTVPSVITVDDLRQLPDLSNVVFLDCRFDLADTEAGRQAFAMGHIPNARYAHLDEDLSGKVIPGATGRHPLPSIPGITARIASWGIESRTHVVAYDKVTGPFAARCWWMLRWLGHERVSVLDGGYAAYHAAGLPIGVAEAPTRSATFTADVQHAMVVEADEVASLAADATACLVDSRAAERFRGEIEPIDPIAGHIPGAVNLDFATHLGEDGTFLPVDQLRSNLERAWGGKSAKDVAFYCGSGVTAAFNILAANHAGLGMPRLYPGSWSEWITNPDRAVATGE